MIKELAEQFYPEISRIRQHLHQHPELSGEEYETSKYIQKELDRLSIPYQVMCETGVVGLIEGKYPGKTVLLRGDIDALPIDEDVDVAFKSKTPGIMHACGHDGHTAGVLGAAMILNQMKDKLHGNVKLMFQPNEEKDGGALPMIEAGILENPKVDAAFGLHLWGPLPKGQVYYRDGSMMASPDVFDIEITGRGTHAAMPQLGIDPIIVASQIVQEFQSVVSRRIDPLKPAVISTTGFNGGGQAHNVIPQIVHLKGTVRTIDNETRYLIPQLMEDVLKGNCLSTGADYQLKYQYVYPPVINHKSTNKVAAAAFAKIVGEENVLELPEPNMGAEDFAYLGQNVPASFMFVGIAEEGKPAPIHHHPQFQWSDDILKITAAGLAQTALDFLGGV
ncbi:MAG: amidohydrolase [Turicibacter sp.]|nr:amidohydrolase [Turicibacter sp.]